jgi:hypothetical protein
MTVLCREVAVSCLHEDLFLSKYTVKSLFNFLVYTRINYSGPGSSVGIASGYGLDGPGIESRWGARFFTPVQTGPEAHPAPCTMGTGSFPGVKRPERGAEHPPPSSVEVKKQ